MLRDEQVVPYTFSVCIFTCANPKFEFTSARGLGTDVPLMQLEPNMMPESGGQ